MLVWILFVNTRGELGIYAQILGTVLSRGAQADARGATQVLNRGGKAVLPGSFLSQVLDHCAEAIARGAVSCASQVLRRGCAQVVAPPAAQSASGVKASLLRYAHVLVRDGQSAAQAAACGDRRKAAGR
jgi:hypothetical protein